MVLFLSGALLKYYKIRCIKMDNKLLEEINKYSVGEIVEFNGTKFRLLGDTHVLLDMETGMLVNVGGSVRGFDIIQYCASLWINSLK